MACFSLLIATGEVSRRDGGGVVGLRLAQFYTRFVHTIIQLSTHLTSSQSTPSTRYFAPVQARLHRSQRIIAQRVVGGEVRASFAIKDHVSHDFGQPPSIRRRIPKSVRRRIIPPLRISPIASGEWLA